MNATDDKNVFVHSFNPMMGKSEWKMIPQDFDYQREVARAAFADMLHDTERNRLYYAGLKAAIEETRRRGREVRVLDIGTGTGLLSMMAATIGADSITACEEFNPIANIAERVIRSNGFSDRIKLVRKRSTEVRVGPGLDMEKRANILVTEVFDTELIGEGAIGTFNHAHRELLTDDCLVVPCEGTMYAQVIQSDLASRWNDLHPVRSAGWTLVPPNYDESGSSSALSLHDVQLTQLKPEWFQIITPPVPVFKFDFSGRSGAIPINEQTLRSAEAARDGRCDAVFIWWDIYMDPAKKVLLSCAPVWEHPSPKDIPWRNHWMQAIYYPNQKVNVRKGERVTVISDHNEYSLLFDVSTKDPETISPIASTIPYGGIHQAGISRTRLGLINHSPRNEKFISALEKCFKGHSDPVVLCLSDQSLLPLMAVACGAKRVYLSEQNRHMKTILEGYVRRNSDVLGGADRFVFLEKDAASLTSPNIPEKLDVVIGEPHFQFCYLPWHNMFYWYCLHQNINIDGTVDILPRKLDIWAIPVEYKDLWKIRSPLVEVEGFKMKHFDDVIMSACDVTDADVEVQPLWEYPCLARAARPVKLITFDLRKPLPADQQLVAAKIETVGLVNGMAIWTDWHLSDDDIDSSGPINPIRDVGDQIEWDVHTLQGVFFFKKFDSPQASSSEQIVDCLTTFNPAEGNIDFAFHLSKRL